MKQWLQIAGLAAVIALAVAWILVQQRDAARVDTRPSEGVGRVMAEETARQLERREKKRVVILSMEGPDAQLQVQEASFLEHLRTLCPAVEIKETVRVAPEGQKRYGPGVGLSARRFVRTVENNVKADALVSFIGLPDGKAPELAGLTNKVPRFIALARDLGDVRRFLDRRWLRAAIVPRFEYPAPAGEPRTPREWFDRQYQVVTTNEIARIEEHLGKP